MLFFLFAENIFAATKTFTGSGNFSEAFLWGGTLPVEGDDLIIVGTCTYDNAANNLAYGNLTLGQTLSTGTVQWTAGQTNTLNINDLSSAVAGSTLSMGSGGIIKIRGIWTSTLMTFIQGGGTNTVHFNNETAPTIMPANIAVYNNIITQTGTQTIAVGANMVVNGTFQVISGTFRESGSVTITGDVTVSGTILTTSPAGTKIFEGNLTINSGGSFNCTVNESFTMKKSITNNGTFTSNNGAYTFSGTGYTFGGWAGLSFDRLSITGTYTNTITSGGGLVSLSQLSGAGSLTQGTGGTLLTIGASSAITTLDASTVSNTVTYNGTAGQTVKGVTYYNLIMSNANTKTLGGATTVNGNLTVNSTATLALGTFNFTVSGSTSITGTLTIASTTGVRTLGNVTVNAGGTWNCTVAEAFTINGNISNSGTFTASTGTYTLAGAGKTISGTFSIPTISVTGSYTNNGTLSSTTTLSGAGTFTQGATGTLNMSAGTFTVATFNALTSGNVVAYNLAGAQNVRLPSDGSYHHLTLSGTGIKTLLGTTDINGNLTISSALSANNFNITLGGNWSSTGAAFVPGTNTVTFDGVTQSITRTGGETFNHLTIAGSGTKTLGSAITTNANLTINSTLDVSASNFAVTLARDWINNGTFTPQGGTVTFNGAVAQSIGGAANTTFNNLTLSTAQTRTIADGKIITVNGTLTWTSGNLSVGSTAASTLTLPGALTIPSTFTLTAVSASILNIAGNFTNNGTFTPGTSTVVFNGGVAQTIGGTAITTFNNITSSNAVAVSLAQAENLTGVLTISSGIFTTTGFNFTLISDASGTASIAAIPAGTDIVGDIIMQRYTGIGPTDWRFLSSAVSGSTLADWADDFATSGFTGATCSPADCAVPGCAATCNVPSIYWYDESQPGDLNNFGYVAATNVANPITVGKGYWVYLGPAPVTFEVTGPPNKFSQADSVTYTNSGDINNDGWNLVSNSYPSAIDWDAPTDATHWAKTNMDAAIYIYNSNTGSYAYHISDCPECDLNGGSRYIASQQAFWVKANAASPTLSKSEDVKASTNPTYLKTLNTNTPNTSGYPMAFSDFPVPLNTNTLPNSIKLTASGNGYDDETFIRFMQGASNNFDGSYDAWKLANINPSLPNISSVLNDSLDISINSYPELNSDVTVKIRLTVPSTGNYSIRRDSILMLPMSSCIFLEDLANGNMIDFRSNISYSFAISDTTAAPRFILHIYAPISKQAVNTKCADDSSGIAIANGTGSGPWNYVWKDSGGNILQTTNNSLTSDSLFSLAVGIYTIEVSGSACGTVTDTIEIKTSSTLAVMANHSDVSCFGLNDGTANATVSGGISPFTYSWSNGDTASAINNLSAGNYSVTTTDDHGCTVTATVSITQPTMLTNNISQTNVSCFGGSNGSASVSSSGGTPSYSYLWSDGQTTSPAVNLSSGTYSVTVTDANGCSQTQFVIISQPAQIVSAFVSSADTLDLSVSGSVSFANNSTGATAYYWTFGDPTSADTSKNPLHYYSDTGTYVVMLIAYNGNCSDTSYATIVVINSLLFAINPPPLSSSSSFVNVIYDHGEIFLAFDLPEEKDISISVYNSLGEKILVQNVRQIRKNKIKLRVENLSAGIYISIADMKDVVIAKKIIIPSR